MALGAVLACASVARAQDDAGAPPPPVEPPTATTEPDAGAPAHDTAERPDAAGADEAEPASASAAREQSAADLGAPHERSARTASGAQATDGERAADAGAGPDAAPAASTAVEVRTRTDAGDLVLTLGGYVETGLTWSFEEPARGIVAWRGFDNRHATFTLANVALRTRLRLDRVYTAITLQWGNTPDTYYLAEPGDAGSFLPPERFGVGASSAATWRFLQEAYVGWDIPVLNGVALEGGLFLSPIGFESMAIRENWNYSRANLFYGLPFYHTGIRAHAPLGDGFTLHLALVNGWNTVLDNNVAKSVGIWVDYEDEHVAAHLLYFGGIERFEEEEGAWRNTFDFFVRWSPLDWIDLALHADAGFEPVPVSARPFGSDSIQWWAAAAGYVHVQPLEWLAIAFRSDFFLDRAPADRADLRIFWPTTPLMSSQTFTLRFDPEPHLAFFVEYRHDHALSQEDAAALGIPRGEISPTFLAGTGFSSTQNTLTLGATAGF